MASGFRWNLGIESFDWRFRGWVQPARLGQRFREHMAVAGSQGNATECCQRRRDVGWGRFTVVLAVLDAKAHQQNRHMLVVVIRSSVPCSVGAGFSGRCSVHQPVCLRYDEEVAAAPREIAVGHGAARRTLCCWAILQLLGAKYFRDSRLRQGGVYYGAYGLRILF